jgi:hypothetical protein
MNQQAYENGIDALKAEDYTASVRDFEECLNSIDELHEQYNKVASYLGLSQVLTNNPNGLLLCRDAGSSEVLDGRVFLNLAISEWRSGNRKRAIDALHRGCKIDAGHTKLKEACALIDKRKKPVLDFLPRDHFLNTMLGRMFRRKDEGLTVQSLLYR